ncbi:HAD-IA family hydrolase [Nocardia fluminea]|uniref:HAD family hydrolase n=1 Tax=Nocardia fluminea TaxID=134984 RepID=UPI0033DE522E
MTSDYYDSAPRRRIGILVDFGGVLTTDVFAALRIFGTSIGVEPNLPLRLLVTDPKVSLVLTEFEAGRCTDAHFERVLARALATHGGTIEARGLLRKVRSVIAPDPEMIELIAGLKAAGHPIALVANSFGRNCFESVDLDDLVDVRVVSAEVGLRKPSRAIFTLACRRLDVEPANAVMIDDLSHNIIGARRAGVEGILHHDARTTAEVLAVQFGIFPVLPPSPAVTNTHWRRRGSSAWLR